MAKMNQPAAPEIPVPILAVPETGRAAESDRREGFEQRRDPRDDPVVRGHRGAVGRDGRTRPVRCGPRSPRRGARHRQGVTPPVRCPSVARRAPALDRYLREAGPVTRWLGLPACGWVRRGMAMSESGIAQMLRRRGRAGRNRRPASAQVSGTRSPTSGGSVAAQMTT